MICWKGVLSCVGGLALIMAPMQWMPAEISEVRMLLWIGCYSSTHGLSLDPDYLEWEERCSCLSNRCPVSRRRWQRVWWGLSCSTAPKKQSLFLSAIHMEAEQAVSWRLTPHLSPRPSIPREYQRCFSDNQCRDWQTTAHRSDVAPGWFYGFVVRKANPLGDILLSLSPCYSYRADY